MAQNQDYLGTGWSFPLKTSLQGGFSLSTADQKVREAILIILRTELGERRYRPDFGCRLSELTFAPMNTKTLFLMRLYVEEALQTWEPRIDLDEVISEPDPILGRVLIQINYRLKNSYEPRSLVYPFYLTQET
ncbi:MAG: GPW/gp25 family protein [Xenococcaceae cyanobacterium MO_167.B52]|nr:GPW/gp25 family protein [Xenococcaceae cyanobacterium MO_167.B52]